MKIRVLSDLHLEFTKYQPETLPPVGEDLVVLAGDIGVGIRGIEWAKRAIPDRPVVYVLGNHEFYREDWDLFLIKAHAAAAGSNVHLLEDEAVEIGGIRVLGCSLWADFRAMGAMTRQVAASIAEFQLNDYRMIRRDRYISRIRPIDTALRCENSRKWLEQEIAAAQKPLLVVTHHAPTLKTSKPKLVLQLGNAAFHNDFDSLIRPPVLAWIHGHTHYSCEALVNGIRVVSNQRGYPGEGCVFDWDFVLEL
jgi:3',5'-cyclic AMP phosphodiesterase CpdA